MPSETVQWMDAIRRTVDEILANVNSQGQVSLGTAKQIAGKPAPKISRAKKMAKAYKDMTEEEKATIQMIGQMAAQFGTGG